MKREQNNIYANDDNKKKRILCCSVVEENGLFGLVNSKGEQVQPCKYLNIHQFSDRQDYEVIVLEDNAHNYWLADKNGCIVTTHSCSSIAPSQYVASGGGCGRWRESGESRNGCIELYNEGKNGLFDIVNVREIVPAIYSPGVPDIEETDGIYSPGIPVMHQENNCYMAKLVDPSGKELIPFECGYSWIGHVPIDSKEYLIAARKDGKYGYINIHGTEKIPFRYDFTGDFKDGYAVVGFLNTQDGVSKSLGVIDHHDRMMIPFKFGYIEHVAVIEGRVFAEGQIGWEMGLPYTILCEDGNCYELVEGSLSFPSELCVVGNKIVRKN